MLWFLAAAGAGRRRAQDRGGPASGPAGAGPAAGCGAAGGGKRERRFAAAVAGSEQERASVGQAREREKGSKVRVLLVCLVRCGDVV